MDISGLVSVILVKGVGKGREGLGYCFMNVW